MKHEIATHLNDPKQLEKMYRNNKASFKKDFNAVYPSLSGSAVADSWHARLNYEGDEISWGNRKELLIAIIASIIAGFIARLPVFLNIDEEFFYSRNIGFIIFPLLSAYFAWRNKLAIGKTIFIIGTTLACLIFINLLPDDKNSDTLVLSCIHLLVFLWAVLGFAFIGGSKNDAEKRLGFLKYNGDLIVITTLVLIAGGILTAITIGLFSLIGLNIEEFYFKNIAIFGLPAAPIIGTYLTQVNPSLVGKISPVIAKIFSPLVLIMLVIYLIAIIYSGKDPYNDREFLFIFNVLLVGVMAIIFFSISSADPNPKNTLETWVLFLLSIVTILVNGIALSAISFRISEWGITPNRGAVLGSNILILIHLLMVTAQLFKILFRKESLLNVGKSIAWYLPVYLIWAVVVMIVFPFLFGFK